MPSSGCLFLAGTEIRHSTNVHRAGAQNVPFRTRQRWASSHHAAASLPCVVRRHLSDGGAASRRATSARPNRASRGARFAAAKQRSAGHRRASGGHTACVILRCVVPDESTASDAVQLLKLVSDAAGRRDLGAIHGALCARWSVGPLHTDWDGDIQGHAAIRGFMEDWFAVLTRSGSARPRSFSTSAMDRLRRVASERPSWWQQRRGPTSLRGRPAVRSGQDSASHELHGHR